MILEQCTYNNGQCVCEHPQIIVNPLLPELISRYGCYQLQGRVFHPLTRHYSFFGKDLRKFSIKKHGINEHNYKEHFVIDEVTGETFPIYIQVPCGKCLICSERKVNAFVQRCEFESQCYDNLPWFITLTYDNAHLPKTGVCKRDIQLFLKRFRINLNRHGYPTNLRYVCASQYGSETFRPHYHLIIWNIPSNTRSQWFEVKDILQRSWANGEVRRPRLIDCSNNKTFYYTCRYMGHDSPQPKGKDPIFTLSSNGHGGIGSKYIDKFAKDIRKTLDINYQFKNKWSQKVKPVVFSQYVLNRVFPAWCRSVPPVLRRALADYSLAYSVLESKNEHMFYQQQFENYEKIFAKDCFFGRLNLAEFSRKDYPLDCGEELREQGKIIEKFRSRVDFSDARRLNYKRNVFVHRLFEFAQPVNISARAYDIRRRLGLAKAREIL